MNRHAFASILINLPLLPMVFGGSSAKITHYAQTGTCEHLATGARRCALTPSDCEPSHVDGEKNVDGERWYSAYRISQKDGAASPCACEATRVSACFAGEAELDADGANLSFRCAANSDSCLLSKGEVFGHMDGIPLANDAQCGCHALGKLEEQEDEGSDEISLGNQRTTLYGACYKDSENAFCAFSPDDCGDDGYTWLDPLSASDLLEYDCTCADTHIGGCVGGFQSFICAVSKHDCTWDTYYPPMMLAQTFGYNCRLCKPFSQVYFHSDTIDKLAAEENTPPATATSASSATVIVAGSCGAAFGIAMALAGVFVYRKHARKKSAPGVTVSEARNTKEEKDANGVTELTERGNDSDDKNREII